MQSVAAHSPATRRPGRKAYPLSSNQRRDEYAKALHTCGHTARTIMHTINQQAEVNRWPPVFSERHVYRIIRAELMKIKCEWGYVGSEAGEREAALARIDRTLERMAVYLREKDDWIFGEYEHAMLAYTKCLIQQARNRGALDVPFRVRWERFPTITNRQRRMIDRAA